MRGAYIPQTYIFRHALTREVVYDSILARKKKELHEEIGKAIEELYKDNLRDHYEVLAEHFFSVRIMQKGLSIQGWQAGKRKKQLRFPMRLLTPRKRIASLERLPQTEDVEKKIIDARTVLGLYLAQLNYYVEAKEAIDPIIDLAIKQDYKRRLCQIYTLQGAYYYFVEEDFPAAFQAFEEALKISEEIKELLL